MVSAVGTRVTQGQILVADASTPTLRATTVETLAAVNFPTAAERVTQAEVHLAVTSNVTERLTQLDVRVAVTSNGSERVSNAVVLAAVRGRISNPKLRAWTFTLDGHDFYVLRLGTDVTLIYDVYSEQWTDWDAFSETYWPVNCGINWTGGTGLLDTDGSSFGSNVLVGDDTYGLLWFLDPNQAWDEAPEQLDPSQEKFFERVLQGQVAMKGREVLPCYAVWLTTDMGDPAYVGAGVKLEISDDAGKTYDDMGTVTVTTGENSPEISWYSLGQIGAPGRLFRITDDGAVARIDAMEMNDPDDNGR